MVKRIMVPLDGTPHSEQALHLVNTLAAKQELELILLKVITQDSIPTVTVPGEYVIRAEMGYYQTLRQNTQYVEEIAEKEEPLIDTIKTIVETGDPAQIIADIANEENIDLLIMVTHGTGLFERFIGSSVTARVIRKTDCPVLAIRDNHVPEHFLIALEETYSEDILPFAFELANLFGSKVTLTTIRRPKDVLSYSDLGEMRYLDTGLADKLVSIDAGKSEHYLNDIIDKYVEKYPDTSVGFDVDIGKPGDLITKIATRNECDLIAMVTHGREGFDWLMNGSVTERVMHRTKGAMLILHKEGEAPE